MAARRTAAVLDTFDGSILAQVAGVLLIVKPWRNSESRIAARDDEAGCHMRDIRIDQTSDARKIIAKTIERIGWGLFFIWAGTAFLAHVGWGGSLAGIGAIMLGAQAARTCFGLKIDWFGLALGMCFAVAGLSQLFDLQLDKAAISGWLVPILLIVAGVAALVSAWRHRPGT